MNHQIMSKIEWFVTKSATFLQCDSQCDFLKNMRRTEYFITIGAASLQNIFYIRMYKLHPSLKHLLEKRQKKRNWKTKCLIKIDTAIKSTTFLVFCGMEDIPSPIWRIPRTKCFAPVPVWGGFHNRTGWK